MDEILRIMASAPAPTASGSVGSSIAQSILSALTTAGYTIQPIWPPVEVVQADGSVSEIEQPHAMVYDTLAAIKYNLASVNAEIDRLISNRS